ncbi:MAG: hypothetical protein K6T83_03185 [Alicyclobacillus sp.]|nr:hypothetical protein [Alicyclobacillus sp.]
MATKPKTEPQVVDSEQTAKVAQTAEAPKQGAFFMHLDDFLNLIHDEIKANTGRVHVESISAFAALKKAANEWKKTEDEWRADFERFLKDTPK